jgi:hypothetical protein
MQLTTEMNSKTPVGVSDIGDNFGRLWIISSRRPFVPKPKTYRRQHMAGLHARAFETWSGRSDVYTTLATNASSLASSAFAAFVSSALPVAINEDGRI